ncbi:response regulator [Tolypothrix sp. PCC 7910]|uniref:hybrid sensor histidine kinase/response regulator n=1 Tax=Tolypothrix sp. PCC 7910 TaxID=2099387 RepID=UPI0014279455|nr:response regulator [Tolypothrix sp. PCC 7910]QIR38191.1 response regulator [Tolypothrix sp. PCC 7910]
MSISSAVETPNMIQVLVVEDEYILAINLQESLEGLGYTVVDIVDSAAEAIERANELRPNLILMDIRLRGEMDGIQAAEEIWRKLQIPVIYLTGHSDKSTVERATLTSPFGYILKPVSEQELYVAIQTAMERYEREQFLSTVLRGMGEGVIVADSQLQVQYLNQVAETLTGWRLEEAKNQMLTEVVQLIEEQTQRPAENPIAIALQTQTTIYLKNRILLVTKNGTKIPVADSATPVRDRSGSITGAVMVFRDDTQRRLNEERSLAAERARQIEIQIAELQRLNQLKEDFLATTSHEMRMPLSNIKMAISQLENVLNQLGILNHEEMSASESVTKYLTILRSQCERELTLIDNLLEMRMIDADVYPLQLTKINLHSFLQQIIDGFQELVQAQQQILEINIAADLSPFVADLNLLTRILTELLNNACKYTPLRERITVNVEYIYPENSYINDHRQSQILSNSPEPILQIKISNYGVEIKQEDQALIFEPFYRITKNKPQQKTTIFDTDNQIHLRNPLQDTGAGLGLTLVKKLVEHLQGSIAVKSNHICTTFTVSLPFILSQ